MLRAVTCALLLAAAPARAQEPGQPPQPPPAASRLVTPPPEEPAPRPLYKKPLFWVVLTSGLAVVATGVALGVVYGSAEHDPGAMVPGR